jgi:hypothetical protein
MDNESLAKDLVVGYVAGHDIPRKSDMQKIAESLVELYRITKTELDKANANAHVSPIGFGSRAREPKSSTED